jgi:hypothetical protein
MILNRKVNPMEVIEELDGVPLNLSLDGKDAIVVVGPKASALRVFRKELEEQLFKILEGMGADEEAIIVPKSIFSNLVIPEEES